MDVSRPRTFSLISQNVSSSLNRATPESPSGVSKTRRLHPRARGWSFRE